MKNLVAQIGLLAGTWITFITSYKDFVELMNKIPFTIIYLSEGWIVFWYFLFLCICCLVGMYLNQKLVIEESKISQNSFEDSNQGGYDKILSLALKRIELMEKLRIIRSFGLVWIIDKILRKKYEVFDIDEFSKPSYWETFPNEQDPSKIIRATIKKERIEIRFKKEEFKILLRKTIDKELSTYGDFEEKDFNLKEFSYLIFICPFYLLKRLIFG